MDWLWSFFVTPDPHADELEKKTDMKTPHKEVVAQAEDILTELRAALEKRRERISTGADNDRRT